MTRRESNIQNKAMKKEEKLPIELKSIEELKKPAEIVVDFSVVMKKIIDHKVTKKGKRK